MADHNESALLSDVLNKTLSTLKLHNKGYVALILMDGEVIATADDIYLSYIIFGGFTMDSVFLSLHLIACFLLPRTKTLPEKNVACFCASLLLNHIFHMIGLVFKGPVCMFTSVFAYYGFIASFWWLLTMSFDVWRSMRAAYRLRLNKDGEYKKFIIYSIFSWAAPGICTFIPVFAWILPEGYLADEFKPDFFRAMCTLEGDEVIEVMFIFTVGMVVVPNLLLFIDTARLVSKIKYKRRFGEIFSYETASKYSHESAKNNTTCIGAAVLSARKIISLSLQTGLIWITIVVIYFFAHINSNLLRYVAFIFASLQGIVVFCLFTCKKDILSAIADRMDS